MDRLTKEQAAIIGAFTGISCGPFSDMHEAVEKKLGRPVYTHEFADYDFMEQLREEFRDDFLAICHAPPSTT